LHAGAARRVNSKFASLAGALSNAWPEMPSIETLQRSCILGYFHVKEIVKKSDPQCVNDPQAVGPFCWIIDRTCELPAPSKFISGKLGLWPSMSAASTPTPADSKRASKIARLSDHPPQQSPATNDKRRYGARCSASSAKCPKGHPLLRLIESHGNLRCDGGCKSEKWKRSLLPDQPMWSCTTCDWDICVPCYDVNYGSSDEPGSQPKRRRLDSA